MRQRQNPKPVPFEIEKQGREGWFFGKIHKIDKTIKE